MKEKIYEKYAWVIFFAIGLLTIAAAVPHALGLNTDPELVKSIVGTTIEDMKLTNPMSFDLYNFYFRSGGLSDFGFAFLLLAISATAYRRGEKWAWYTFWIVPVFFLGFVALSSTLKSSSSLVPPLMVFIVLSLIGLILPFRKFFPKKA